MDILLSTNNTTLTFHTIEAVNINKERHHTCSIYMEWNTYYAFKIYFRATLQYYRYL